MSDEKTVGQLMRWKFRAREAEQKLAEKDKMIADLTRERDEIQGQFSELEDEVSAYIEEQESPDKQSESDKVISELRTQIVKANLQHNFEKRTGDRLSDKVTFDDVLQKAGLNLAELDENTLDDAFYDGFIQDVTEKAPYFFRPQQEASGSAKETASQDSQSGAKRNLPTFFQRSSGGGTPPPVEPSLTAARLRDPAEAIKRAAEARAESA